MSLSKQVAGLQKELKMQTQRTIDLQKITIRLDSYDKRYNIIVVGLPETDNENLFNSLVLLLSRTGRTFTEA